MSLKLSLRMKDARRSSSMVEEAEAQMLVATTTSDGTTVIFYNCLMPATTRPLSVHPAKTLAH